MSRRGLRLDRGFAHTYPARYLYSARVPPCSVFEGSLARNVSPETSRVEMGSRLRAVPVFGTVYLCCCAFSYLCFITKTLAWVGRR